MRAYDDEGLTGDSHQSSETLVLRLHHCLCGCGRVWKLLFFFTAIFSDVLVNLCLLL